MRKRMPIVAMVVPVALVVLVALVLVTGLGLADAPASAAATTDVAERIGGSTLTEKQWRAKANALCRAAARRTQAVRARVFEGLEPDEQPSVAQFTLYVKGVAPIVRGVIRDINELREPEKLSKKVERFVATARRELRLLVADPSRGLEGNPFSDTSLRVGALGLQACV